MEISGKSAIVTGAASGIGRETAVLLAKGGAAEIALVDIQEEGLVETARLVEEYGTRAAVHLLDISDVPATEAWFLEHGDVDILHNNAGVVTGLPGFPDTDASRVQWIVDINVTSPIVASQIAIQAMRKRGGGVIVNTASTAALGTTFPDYLYTTTKSAVLTFTKTCAPLKDSDNIQVTAVLPGLVQTPILHTTGVGGKEKAPWMESVFANNEFLSPTDIAEAVITLVEDEELPGGDWVAVRKIDGQTVRQWGHDEA